jgi:molybdopterin/thiamine biosynthesis adenylyltransferase
MQIETTPASRWLIRPSVSVIPVGDGIFEFFQSSTRRSIRFRLRSEIANVVRSLDGSQCLEEVCQAHGATVEQISRFMEILHERCAVEPKAIRDAIDATEHYRVLNFLGDYFPAVELFAAFEKIRSTRVAILGCGAVGSWTAVQLAHSGLEDFTVIDGDHVEESNLNRSIFLHEDIGAPKVEAIESALHRISPRVWVQKVKEKVSDADGLRALLSESRPDVIVNCADEPSVDLTSEWINEYCQHRGVPYVIAGGYNLHLSLIGMTVSPGVSACFNCSRITLDELEDESLQGVRRLWRPKRNLGSLSPLTGITSSLATSEVLRLAVRSERLRPAMWNRRGEFNFLTNELSFVNLPPRSECGCTAESIRSSVPKYSK